MADTAPRVPAWKRLGLKLKYAQDINPSQTSTTTTTTPPVSIASPPKPAAQHPKRPLEDASFGPETPAKRAKPKPERQPFGFAKSKSFVPPEQPAYVPKRYGFAGISVEPSGKKITFGDDDNDPAVPPESEVTEVQQVKATRPSILRKSVSFTPDTKQKDGETGQQYFKAWASGQDPTAVDPSTEQTSPSKPAKEPKEKKTKKPKKSKSTTISEPKTSKNSKDDDSTSRNSKDIPVYVEYLQQYYTDRNNWRFKKNNQNDLLKNLFNIYRIPEEHNPAIIAYLNGLQGSARDRVAIQAEDVLKDIYESSNPPADEAMSLNHPAARKAAYYGALVRQTQKYEAAGAGRSEYNDEQLREIREKVLEGRRAEAVLEKGLMAELRPDMLITPPASATPEAHAAVAPAAVAVEPPAKTKRKRKARTDVSSSSDNSSSDDSSSSDSDGDRDNGSKAQPPAKKAKKGGIFDADLLDIAFANRSASKSATTSKAVPQGKVKAKTLAMAAGTRGQDKDDVEDSSSEDSSSSSSEEGSSDSDSE